jgi:NAD+ synthase
VFRRPQTNPGSPAVTDKLRIAIAQINPTVGALDANLGLALGALKKGWEAGADILALPELVLTGYFPEDLLLKPQFVADAIATAKTLAKATKGTGVAVVIPTPWLEDGRLFNGVVLAEGGEITDWRAKHRLPNEDVFYEKRYFCEGPLPTPMAIKGVLIGVPICEDIWHKHATANLARTGAKLIVCPNGSPYRRRILPRRYGLARARVRETGLPLIYLNQVGAQDELVFDGASFAVDATGRRLFEAKSFEPDFIVSDWQDVDGAWRCTNGKIEKSLSGHEAQWRAAVLGTRDYVRKNGFEKVVLGLSGGIDSAVVAALAVDALGPENVHGVMLAYRYTSNDSLNDAKGCAARLGLQYDILEIGGAVDPVNEILAPLFEGKNPDITEENIQSRTRGTLLMALSNKLGALLLTTGNKSEMAVGYATLYGDMNGGFNPIKDMFKTAVYHLAEWRNSHMPADCLGPNGEVIPARILTKAPTAELRENQTDQDSLPAYDVLDPILEGLIEEEASVAQLVASGFERATVRRVERLVYRSEFKRRQAAPGPKLTEKAFGIGRKYPMTSGYADKSGSER